MEKIKCILFDMDGVLVDAKDWQYEALNKSLSLFGLQISRYDHLHTFDGLPTRDKLKIISSYSYLPESLHPFINELKQKYTQELVEIKCKPVFQHEYALAKLKRDGYVMAVCSNSVKATIEHMMKKAALIDYFDLIMSNEDVVHAKPNPEIYIKAMERLEFSPEECLVLEDNKNGIMAAEASGANLLKVHDTEDVNYQNIINRIKELEAIK